MKTRSLTEGAMLAALTVILTMISHYLGIPSIIVPVPLMLLVYRQGFRWGIITAFVAAIVTALVAGHVFAGLSIIIWGFVGVAVGMALREKFSFPKLMGVGIFSNLVVIGLNVLLYSLIFGTNMFTDLMKMLVQSIEMAMETSQSLGVAADALVLYESLLEFVPFFFKWGLPALLLVYSVAMSYINLAVLRVVLKRMGDSSMLWIAPFTTWRLHPIFSILFFFGMIVTTVSQSGTIPSWLQLLGVNLFIIMVQAYVIMGISLVWFYFKKRNTPVFLRVIFVFLVFTWQFLLMALLILALADGVFDFRRLTAVKEEAEEIAVEEND
ncbi:MAG: DUF2232 domain-containing protein [Firmicutes bacterium]|nr:DUF2232 domain-containing protein [Bacillota bacterium]